MDNIHKGHRERLKARFKENGLKAFSDVEALELLLCFALPRCNTNDIAHALLERFGSYRGVLEASAGELKAVNGMGESAAMLVQLLREMNRRYMLAERSTRANVLSSTDAAVGYLRPLFAYATDEQAYALYVNGAGRVIRCRELARGMSNRVEFSARQVVETAIGDNAVYVILAHNHLNDMALPSRADIAATEAIGRVLEGVGVRLLDHIIISGEEYVSMRDSGYFNIM